MMLVVDVLYDLQKKTNKNNKCHRIGKLIGYTKKSNFCQNEKKKKLVGSYKPADVLEPDVVG